MVDINKPSEIAAQQKAIKGTYIELALKAAKLATKKLAIYDKAKAPIAI